MAYLSLAFKHFLSFFEFPQTVDKIDFQKVQICTLEVCLWEHMKGEFVFFKLNEWDDIALKDLFISLETF